MKKLLLIFLVLCSVVGYPQTRPSILQVDLVPSIADLRLIRPSTNNLFAKVAGYYSAGDGGGGDFYWSSASTAADDGGMVILPTGHTAAGRWLRQSNRPSVKDYGAVGDGATDDTASIRAAIANNETVYFPLGSYLVSETITINKTCRLLGEDVTGVEYYTGGITGAAFDVEFASSTTQIKDLLIRNIKFNGKVDTSLSDTPITNYSSTWTGLLSYTVAVGSQYIERIDIERCEVAYSIASAATADTPAMKG